MRLRGFVYLAVLCAVMWLSGCALEGQAADAITAFQGDWVLEKSFGVTPPAEFETRIQTGKDQLVIHSRWKPPADGRYGLTLMGVTTPEFEIDTSGREQAAQIGPFVFRYTSGIENRSVVTHWSTSEYMGSSFHGTWTRAVTKDGTMMTLDINASSSSGEMSRARLIFKRH
jgi:hypothetical protein